MGLVCLGCRRLALAQSPALGQDRLEFVDQRQRVHAVRLARYRVSVRRRRDGAQRGHRGAVQGRSVRDELVETRQVERVGPLVVVLCVHLAQRWSNRLDQGLDRVYRQLGLVLEVHHETMKPNCQADKRIN